MAKKKRRYKGSRDSHPKKRSNNLILSVCMIAKDEEEFLGQCLDSVKGLANEILIGDTGSSDQTRKVARNGGARVLDLGWQGHFSRAWNAVLASAMSDWILVLDCDEVLARRDWGEIRKTLASGLSTGYRMTTRNYISESNYLGWQVCTGAYREEKNYSGWFPTTRVRLFRNDPRIRFDGALHELVEGSLERIGEPIGDCLVPVHHYGYVEKERTSARVLRYSDVAEKKIFEESGNPKSQNFDQGPRLLEGKKKRIQKSNLGKVIQDCRKGSVGNRLSLCMIVKNEEKRLGQCLDSVQGLVDEIVVVDTGSNDRTVEVAKWYGARIGYFDWCDDWSSARNVSIDMATGDWIMWLDADDILPLECHQPIRGLISRGQDKAYFFVLDSRGYKKISCLQLRLFPNIPGVEFEMPVHEQVTPSLSRLGLCLEPTEIRVVHTGYTTPEVVRKKQDRYLGIMERWLGIHPENYIVRSHVAMTYYFLGKIDRAIAHYEKILYDSNCRKDRNLIVETMSLLYMGTCYLRKGELKKARFFLEGALKSDDKYAMTNLTLGEYYLKVDEPDRALSALKRARQFEDQTTFAAIDPVALKFSIRFLAGQSLEVLGRLEESLECFRKALVVDSTRSVAYGACATVLRKLGRTEEAIIALEEALKYDPDNPKHCFNRGTFYLESGDESQARRWFQKALEGDPNMAEPYLNLGILARRKGDRKHAEEMYRKAVDRSQNSYEPMVNLGHLLLDQERYDEAEKFFVRVREMRSGLLDVDLGLLAVYASEGRLDAVVSLTSDLLKTIYGDKLQISVPASVNVTELSLLLTECGRMLLQKKLIICARLAFLGAHLLDTESVGAEMQLAEVYRGTGEEWKAVSIYERLIQKYPKNPDLFRKLGYCYEAKGILEACQICSDQAISLEK